jgi:hypothetical protein
VLSRAPPAASVSPAGDLYLQPWYHTSSLDHAFSVLFCQYSCQPAESHKPLEMIASLRSLLKVHMCQWLCANYCTDMDRGRQSSDRQPSLTLRSSVDAHICQLPSCDGSCLVHLVQHEHPLMFPADTRPAFTVDTAVDTKQFQLLCCCRHQMLFLDCRQSSSLK